MAKVTSMLNNTCQISVSVMSARVSELVSEQCQYNSVGASDTDDSDNETWSANTRHVVTAVELVRYPILSEYHDTCGVSIPIPRQSIDDTSIPD